MLQLKTLPLAATAALALLAGSLGAQESRGVVHAVDLDQDGLMDRLLFGAEDTLVERNRGGGAWENRGSLPPMLPRDLLVADLDGDGEIDLLVLDAEASRAYFGDGRGRLFAAPEGLGLDDLGPAESAEHRDLDGDGLSDLLLHTRGGDVFLYAIQGRMGVRYERDPQTPPADADLEEARRALEIAVQLVGEWASPDVVTDLASVLLDRGDPRDGRGSGDEPAYAASMLSPSSGLASSTPGLAYQPLIPSLAQLKAMFVDDDAGEVGSADIIDQSLQGGDVSTHSGDVVHLDGRLGIGLQEPLADVHVRGEPGTFQESVAKLYLTPDVNSFQPTGDSELRFSDVEDASRGIALRYEDDASQLQYYGLAFDSYDGPYLTVGQAEGMVGVHTDDPKASLGVKIRPDAQTILRGIDADDETVFRVREDGRTGIGTGSPDAALGVQQVGSTQTILRAIDSFGDTVFRVNHEGGTGIGTATPAAALGVQAVPSVPTIIRAYDAAGDTVMKVTETGRVVTTALEITGGGDLVEDFHSSAGEIEPGTVVSIDPRDPGRVQPSRGAYDAKVVGAVSGANGVNHGIRMVQEGVLEGDVSVAMTGRIWVKCSTENGPVTPGDRLTTASLEGHAMRATDVARTDGAVIGKALSALDDDTGLVLVLVNLQ